jgi:hypothetical protein
MDSKSDSTSTGGIIPNANDAIERFKIKLKEKMRINKMRLHIDGRDTGLEYIEFHQIIELINLSN